MSDLKDQAIEAFVRMANDAAESVAKEVGAPYAIVLLAGGGGPLVCGCWVPDPAVARQMLADALEAMDTHGSNVTVRDLRGERSS